MSETSARQTTMFIDTHKGGRVSRHLSLMFLAATLALLAALGVGATSASAARTYECQITASSTPSATECNGSGNTVPGGAFSEPWGIAVDGNDNVWVDDPGPGTLDKFDSSGNFVLQGVGEGYYARSLAFSAATNSLYVGDSNQDDIWIHDLSGNQTGDITTIRSSCCYLSVGADNSGGPSNGSIYVVSSSGSLYKFDGAGNPVNFSGSASYINGNTLTGTGSRSLSFGSEPGGVAVDGSGNIYATDQGSNAVDEFAPTGIFIREITETPGGQFGHVSGIAVDPTSDDLLVLDSVKETIEEFDSSGTYLDTTTSAETPTGTFSDPRNIAVDSSGRTYVTDAGENRAVQVFSPNVVLPKITYQAATNQTQTGGTLHAEIDPNGGGDVISCKFEIGPTSAYGTELPCSPNPALSPPGSYFTTPTAASANVSGLTTETTYHYRVIVANANGTRKGGDRTFIPHAVAELTTDTPANLEPTSVRLRGFWNGDGDDTTYHFEWGTTTGYGASTSVMDGGSGTGHTAVFADLTELSPITEYHYRIVAHNSAGTSYGDDQAFTTPPNAPLVKEWVSGVHSDTVMLNASINPGGGTTTYHFEWGPTEAYGTNIPLSDPSVGAGLNYVNVNAVVRGLSPGTTYHYRVVATNAQDETPGADRTFTTFPFTSVLDDPCPNALVRKQTGAALLPDCRAYEIASAAESGGYDVESDLVPGQSQLNGYPGATDPSRLLYTVHYGAIPGTGQPTNFGPDPYVATRGENGWTTRYVGVPADAPPVTTPFASPLSGADATLSDFAFGGTDFCSPCFADGSVGVPIRLPDGSLVQGMAGSIPVSDPQPAGRVEKQFSADGSHFVFGSTQKFEPDGNSGQVSIYDRNLEAGVTHVVSKTPLGVTMTGSGIAELDISNDGSRILIGQLVGTDAEGNGYYHLYMNVGDSSSTIDLTPGATDGVLYDGMTSDGSKVFFTTKDALSADGDTSADIYRADVSSSSSSATLTRISTGIEGTGDTDACTPSSNWNTPEGGPNCDAVAIAGGGGVSADDGSIYFLSPEKLDGTANGQANQPNLYVARPGYAPHYITTLEVGNPAVVDGVTAAGTRNTTDFEVSPSGEYAVFSSRLSLTGYDNDGHVEIYRYGAPGDALDCVSCAPTGARSTGDATLATHGSSLTNDGRVFFTSSEPLAPRDLNGKLDAYEWENGTVSLISTGSSPFDSGLLSVSANGLDAYIFTHDVLTPQDHNGTLMKIYDAREGGGFLYESPPQPCQASDECHGRGSEVPAPPSIRTVTGNGRTPKAPAKPKKCKRGAVVKHDKCVKKTHHRHPRKRHGHG